MIVTINTKKTTLKLSGSSSLLTFKFWILLKPLIKGLFELINEKKMIKKGIVKKEYLIIFFNFHLKNIRGINIKLEE